MKLAKVWLEDNQPCTVEQYFVSVPPLMPKHIIRCGKRASQLWIAKEALNYLVANGSVCINDCICTVQKRSQKCLWPQLIAGNSVVNVNELAREYSLTKRQIDTFRKWLRYYGYRSSGTGVYQT